MSASKKYTYHGNGILSYQTKAGETRYGIQYTERGRTVRRMVGKSKSQAKAALKKVQGDVIADRFGLPTRRTGPKFREYAKDYQSKHSNVDVKRSWKRDETSLVWLLQHFGSKPIDRITSDDVSGYRAWRRKAVFRKKPISGSTINREVSLLRHMMNQAIASGLVEHNPVAGVKQFKEDNSKCWHIVTQAEETALLEAAADHLKPLIVVAIETGMRKGELLALDWRKVNLKEKLIQVVTGSSGDTKSGKARWVPISDAARAALRGLEPKPAGPVFTYRGKPLRGVKDGWLSACKTVGMKCRFHDLRHTAISRMIAAGVTVPHVQQIAGHSSIVTTMLYVHLDPRQTDEFRAAMATHRQKQESKCLISVRRGISEKTRSL